MDMYQALIGTEIMLVLIFAGQGTSQGNDACLPTCLGRNCNFCPPDFYLYNSSSFQNATECIYPTTTPSQETTSTSIPETTRGPSLSYSSNETRVGYLICVITCPKGFYGSSNNECVLCDSLCTTCTGRGNTTNVCECKYGNDTNGICLEKKTETEEGINEAVLIGAGVGGGILLIIIVVVIVILIVRRRKKKDKKSRMSKLIEDRDSTIDNTMQTVNEADGRRKIPTLQRQTYENTGKFDDSNVAKQAQLNQDKIFRYVKDPVTGIQKKVEVQQQLDSDIYANASAVKLNQTLQGRNGEEIELSMLGEAPKVPGSTKKKRSFFSKLSSRRKTQQQKSTDEGVNNPTCTVDDDQENYEDMTGKQAPEQPNYTAFDPTEEEEPQENYMNYEQDDMPQEDYENFGITKQSSKNTTEDSDEEQEDYENVQKALDDTEQEDYENFALDPSMPPPPPPSNMMFVNDDDEPTEDYENLQKENPYMNISFRKK